MYGIDIMIGIKIGIKIIQMASIRKTSLNIKNDNVPNSSSKKSSIKHIILMKRSLLIIRKLIIEICQALKEY